MTAYSMGAAFHNPVILRSGTLEKDAPDSKQPGAVHWGTKWGTIIAE